MLSINWILCLTILSCVNTEKIENMEKFREEGNTEEGKFTEKANPEERSFGEEENPEEQKIRTEENLERKHREKGNLEVGNREEKNPEDRNLREEENPVKRNFGENVDLDRNKFIVEKNLNEWELRGEGNQTDGKLKEENLEDKKLTDEGHPEISGLQGTENTEERKLKEEVHPEEGELKREWKHEVNPGPGNPEERKLKEEVNPEEHKLRGEEKPKLTEEEDSEEKKLRREGNQVETIFKGKETPEERKLREEANPEERKLTRQMTQEERKQNEGGNPKENILYAEGNPEARKRRGKVNPNKGILELAKQRGESNPEWKLRGKENPEALKFGPEENPQERKLKREENTNEGIQGVGKLRGKGNPGERKVGQEGNPHEKIYEKTKNPDEEKILEEENSVMRKLKAEAGQPNIVFIVADDLGWDDVSFHGSDQIPTPNIDTLAYQGIILQQYYTDTLGTASRSALFTGKYPSRLGTQSISIQASEDRGIPVSEKLLPEYLKQLGYTTHLVGKWHVGKSRKIYLPTNRGFDSFYGFLGGSVDYYTYNLIEDMKNTTSSFYGLDFFENIKPVEGLNGHLTDIITDRAIEVIRAHNKSSPLYLHVSHAAPHTGGALISLQAPVEFIAANEHIAHSARRHYAGLVTSLDKSVGRVVSTLAEREMLQNTIIVFVSDNGAPTAENFGSNLPLRGTKDTPWEGGARSIALLWNPSLNGGIWRGLFHVTDWMPTLVTAAGGNVNETVDGVNQWTTLTAGGQPRRNDVLVTIDDIKGWAAFREGDFKIIVGELQNEISRYQGQELQAIINVPPAYERALLESETWRVLKETTDIVLDVDAALAKRNRSNLLLETIPVQDVVPCVPTRAKGCLYNISEDPLEARDLWNEAPEIVKRMSLRLRSLWAQLKPRGTLKQDLRADPTKHDYVWTPWVPDDEPVEYSSSVPPFPLAVSMGELQYLVDLNLNIFRQRTFDAIKNMGSSFLKSVGGLFNF